MTAPEVFVGEILIKFSVEITYFFFVIPNPLVRKIIEIHVISRLRGKGYSRRPRLLHDRSLGFPSHGNRTDFLFSPYTL